MALDEQITADVFFMGRARLLLSRVFQLFWIWNTYTRKGMAERNSRVLEAESDLSLQTLWLAKLVPWKAPKGNTAPIYMTGAPTKKEVETTILHRLPMLLLLRLLKEWLVLLFLPLELAREKKGTSDYKGAALEVTGATLDALQYTG